MPKTAVIYARFSCSKQREASIDDQLRECRAWCEREGIEVVREYCDHAVSGRTDERPEFQRMISSAGESDLVVVYMMDRFSRSEFDAPIYKRELQRHGVQLVSALERIPESPEGILTHFNHLREAPRGTGRLREPQDLRAHETRDGRKCAQIHAERRPQAVRVPQRRREIHCGRGRGRRRA